MKIQSFSKSNMIEPDFKHIFESSPGLYLILSPDYQIVAVSNAYLEATMTKRNEILGRSLFDVFPDNPAEVAATGITNLRKSLERVLTQKVPDTMAIQKYDIRKPESEKFEERYWSPVNSPVFDADQNVCYIIHRVEDVTEFLKLIDKNECDSIKSYKERMEVELVERNNDLHHVREELMLSNSSLRRVNKELESFSYSISHDLRAPLRAIDGFSKILQDKYQEQLPVEAKHFLSMVRDSAKEMGHLIDDLLAFSRLGRQDIVKQSLSLSELASEVVEKIKVDDKNRNRNIEVIIEDLPPTEGDRALLKQVLVNLISNAFKFTKNNAKAKIEIGVDLNAPNPVYYVKDNGAGFDMRYASKLFGVFQRLHRAEEYEGTGVGLAIVERIIAKHNGKVWAQSEPGKGATFYFTLGGENNGSG